MLDQRQVSFYEVGGLVCQGKTEKCYIEFLISRNIQLPSKGQVIKTPIGNYTPDFEYPDRYVEIKSPGTYKVMLGERPYIKGGRQNDLQKRKIDWVSANIKTVQVIIIEPRRKYNRIKVMI